MICLRKLGYKHDSVGNSDHQRGTMGSRGWSRPRDKTSPKIGGDKISWRIHLAEPTAVIVNIHRPRYCQQCLVFDRKLQTLGIKLCDVDVSAQVV